MEKAIIINRIQDFFKFWKKDYRRVYFGHEFCPRLLPSRKELGAAFKVVKKEKLNLTLLTPWVDSEGLERIKKIIEYSAEQKMLEEVVINDYGVLYFLMKQYPHCKRVAGRMLSSIVIFNPQGVFDKEVVLKHFEFDHAEEIRNRQQLLAKANLPSGASIKFSYYHPRSLIFATRYCPIAGIFRNDSENHGIIKCSQECLKIGWLKLKNPLIIKPLELVGNAIFVKDKKINLNSLNDLKIDRCVFQPPFYALLK